ncbi:MAG: hypothetical protein J2P28_09800, partial [Actinobacteria bacterium]|nr:hypothetical protein [Actinomycetota bacterium]
MGSFTVRRMRSAWLLVGCLAVTVLVTSALVSALVGFYRTALPAAVTSELATASGMSIAFNGDAGTGVRSPAPMVAARLSRAFGAIPFRMYQTTWSDSLAVPTAHQSGQVPIIQAAVVGGIEANAQIVSGTWPGPPRHGQPIPIAVPATAARDLGLTVGSVLSVRDLTTGSQVRLQVSGVYRPRQPSGAYWQMDIIGASGVSAASGFIDYGPAVVTPPAFGASGSGLLTASQLSMVALPRTSGIRPPELTPLAQHIARAVGSINTSGSLTANTAMPQQLTDAAAGLATARSLILIGGLQLLLLAGAALALASRLLASYREEETAVLAARGAAHGQLIRLSLTEATVGTAVSAAAGVIAGGYLSAVLQGQLTGLTPATVVPGAGAWVAAGVLAVLALAFVMWPTMRTPDVAVRRRRAAPVAVAVAAGADVALLVLAVLAVRELRGYSAGARLAGSLGIDPVVAIGPALALAGLAIVPLRLLPVAARRLERLTAQSSRFGTAMANWEISRRPLRQSGPALLVILAVGASTLALAQYQSWRQSLRDQAAFATGADVSLQPQFASQAETNRIGALAGVTAAMPVSSVPLESSGQLLVIDAAQAAHIVTLRSDLSSRPAEELFGAITTRSHQGLVLPGHPQRLAITAMVTGPGGASAGSVLGPVTATLTIEDASGVGYAVQSSAMPADGRPHELVARLGGAGVTYPFRLIGLSIGYALPGFQQSARAAVAGSAAMVRLDGISVSPAPSGALAPPFAAGHALASWPVRITSPELGSELAGLGGATLGAVQPSIDTIGGTDGAELVTFNAGNGPQIRSTSASSPSAEQPVAGEIDFDIPPARYVPVIATTAFAAANRLTPGKLFRANIAGAPVTCKLAATVAGFPAGAALVADQEAVQDALASQGDGGALPVTEWWLATASGATPRGIPADWAVSDAAALADHLGRDPLSAAPVRATAAIAVAVALIAAFGFCVSVAASARERRGQRALLSALGVPGATQAGLFCMEEALVSIPAAAIGLAIGVGLAHLIVPALTLTATGAMPVPSVLVVVPLGWVLGV